MKKVFSFIMGLVAMTSLYAANTEVARLTLTGQGGVENSYITLRVDPTVTTAQTGAYFQNTDLDGNVNLYISNNTEKYSSYKKDDLTNLPLEVITNRRAAANQHYTITFNVPTSTVGLKLKDLKTGDNVDIVNNGTYEFDVNTTLHPDYVEGTNYVIKDRFVINYTYVIMKGDFTDPSWAYTSNFTHDGATASLDLTLDADTWYHFQIEENGAIGANGSAFDRGHTSYIVPTTGWVDQLTLYADVAGTYTFTWEYASRTLTITFPTPLPTTSITTNAYGFRSFAWAEDVEFLGGVKAYKGEFNSSTFELTLTEVGTKVPAGAGVILWNPNEASETFYFNTSVDASSVDMSGNDFVGAVDATPVAGISADAIYCLSGNQLMKYVGTDDIPAGKAYLPVSTGGAPAPKHIVMRFNGTQAIDNVEGEAVKAVKFVGEDGQILIKRGDEVFNLQGQKVNF